MTKYYVFLSVLILLLISYASYKGCNEQKEFDIKKYQKDSIEYVQNKNQKDSLLLLNKKLDLLVQLDSLIISKFDLHDNKQTKLIDTLNKYFNDPFEEK